MKMKVIVQRVNTTAKVWRQSELRRSWAHTRNANRRQNVEKRQRVECARIYHNIVTLANKHACSTTASNKR